MRAQALQLLISLTKNWKNVGHASLLNQHFTKFGVGWESVIRVINDIYTFLLGEEAQSDVLKLRLDDLLASLKALPAFPGSQGRGGTRAITVDVLNTKVEMFNNVLAEMKNQISNLSCVGVDCKALHRDLYSTISKLSALSLKSDELASAVCEVRDLTKSATTSLKHVQYFVTGALDGDVLDDIVLLPTAESPLLLRVDERINTGVKDVSESLNKLVEDLNVVKTAHSSLSSFGDELNKSIEGLRSEVASQRNLLRDLQRQCQTLVESQIFSKSDKLISDVVSVQDSVIRLSSSIDVLKKVIDHDYNPRLDSYKTAIDHVEQKIGKVVLDIYDLSDKILVKDSVVPSTPLLYIAGERLLSFVKILYSGPGSRSSVSGVKQKVSKLVPVMDRIYELRTITFGGYIEEKSVLLIFRVDDVTRPVGYYDSNHDVLRRYFAVLAPPLVIGPGITVEKWSFPKSVFVNNFVLKDVYVFCVPLFQSAAEVYL